MATEPKYLDKSNWASTLKIAVEDIQDILREILDKHPTGISEYDLMKELAKRDVILFNENYFNNPFGLFQRHFLLFHSLYVLRDNLRDTRKAELTIHCLCIQCIPYGNNPSDYPSLPDSLATYYLDLENLKNTDEAEVLRILDNFWKICTSDEKRDEALAVMKLTHPTTYPAIKQQYRRLAMQLHPDRGGVPEEFHQLESAMEVLRILYR